MQQSCQRRGCCAIAFGFTFQYAAALVVGVVPQDCNQALRGKEAKDTILFALTNVWSARLGMQI